MGAIRLAITNSTDEEYGGTTTSDATVYTGDLNNLKTSGIYQQNKGGTQWQDIQRIII